MIHWRFAPFAELSALEVHDLLQARAAVFVVEQDCVFQDVDGVDPACWHLLGRSPSPAAPSASGARNVQQGVGEGRGEGHCRGEGPLVAYCRLVPPGVKYPEPSIGRVLTAEAARHSGAGRALMAEALARAGRLWPGQAIRIGAQHYLERFYGTFGFVQASDPYDEDGIQHIEMVRNPER